VQVVRFGRPAIDPEPHVPAAAGTDVPADVDEDEVDADALVEPDEEDELADVDAELLAAEGEVGSSEWLLLENWHPVRNADPTKTSATADRFFFISVYTFVSAYTVLAREMFAIP